jgi:hypothetical protein
MKPLTATDVSIAELDAFRLSLELCDVEDEYRRVADKMQALSEKLCAMLDLREDESWASYQLRYGANWDDESDKPQVLLVRVAFALRMVSGEAEIKYRDYLTETLEKVKQQNPACVLD